MIRNPNWYYGWHFLPADGCLAHCETKIKVKAGEHYFVEPPIIACENGLHASARALDALRHAPGSIVERVILSGEIVLHGEIVLRTNKAAASERTVVKLEDATNTLHEFACQCAEDVLHLCDKPVEAKNAIDTKRRWLRSEVTDCELDVARAAAYGFARDAAYAAAHAAAHYDHRIAAARDAAYAAAHAAAHYDLFWITAAYNAAYAAARAAAHAAARDTACAATFDATFDAIYAVHNARLEQMLFSLLGLDPLVD